MRLPGPGDIPGGPPSPNGGPRQVQVQLPPIALTGIVPPNVPTEIPLGPYQSVTTRSVQDMADGTKLVCERIATREGVRLNWFTPDDAIETGRVLIQMGRIAKSNLQLPPGAQLPAVNDDEEVAALGEQKPPEQAGPTLIVPE